MKKRTIQLIVLFASLSLAGIVVTQLFWIRKSVRLQEVSFDNRVKEAIRTTAEQILIYNKDSSTHIEPIVKTGPLFFVCNVDTDIDSFLLGKLLSYEFKYQNISTDYEYGIYDCFSDSVVHSRAVVDQVSSTNPKAKVIKEIEFDRASASIWVHFPKLDGFMISEMSQWLITSALLLLITILTFSYTIFSIIRQKQITEMKTDFINNMTHELKTPISTIALSSEVLLKPSTHGDTEKIKRYASIISEENERLKNQVEKVLQMAMLERGTFELNRQLINIHKLIEVSVEKLRLKVRKQHGSLVFEAGAENSLVQGDWEHIQNVILNLLDNALKYSVANPEVLIRTTNSEGGINLVVEDKGMGMKPEVVKHIFDRFYRAPTGDVHDVKGFGLGLNYVKAIVDAHAGTVCVESEINNGSVFTVFLPHQAAG
ncbi:MAG: HAMP domain-containing histidine kinase [Flavobacteriales bacterium]|nr:HAMP domain-containing histidine kinase [Flavobacteriales bacterium]